MSKGMPIIRDDKKKSIGRSAIKDKGTKYNMPTLPDNFDLDRQKAVQAKVVKKRLFVSEMRI
jgi:hypothetical protein